MAKAVWAMPATVKIINETEKLTAFDGEAGDSFGHAVSFSGNLAIVGAFVDDDKGVFSGSAYIYAFDGTTWNFQAKLTGLEEVADDQFGYAVAVSGNMALVGAPFDSTLGLASGAVYVFTFDGTFWTQRAKLFGSDIAGDLSNFGVSIALSGEAAVIGASGFHDPGAAYVFSFNGTTWSEQARLTASDGSNLNDFASSVSLSGNRVLVGAFQNGLGGAAYVFSFDGTSWSQEAKLTASDTAEDDQFGWSVSLSGDLALIGAPNSHNKGQAYIFAFDGTTWSQQTRLKDPGGKRYDAFGSSVALSDMVALVGARQFADPGTVYVYSMRRNSWTLRAQLLASGGVDGETLGVSVALSGNTVLAGADDSHYSPGAGQAYIFSLGR